MAPQLFWGATAGVGLGYTTARAIADGAARKSISSRSTSFALSRLISSSQPSSFFQRCTTIHQPTKYSSSLLTGHNFSTAVAPDLDDAKEDSMQKAELIRRIKVRRYYIYTLHIHIYDIKLYVHHYASFSSPDPLLQLTKGRLN